MANLKSVLKCWTEFNLPALQKSLDEEATEIVQRQDEAEKAKKHLIELTKDWRKVTDELIRTKCSPLIKAFQREIDTLNKRSKTAESSFLHLYKNLLEIPDPVPSLKQVDSMKKQLEKLKDLEIENKKLHDTLSEYNNEFAEVKNQEVTIQKLKEKIKGYEEQAEEKLRNILVEKEKSLQDDYVEREQRHLDEQLEVATKLGEAESKVKNLTKDLVNAQVEIFELKAKHEEELIARLSEIEILETDLERVNSSLAVSEKQIEALELQPKVSGNKEDEIESSLILQRNNDAIKTLEYQLLSKEKEMSEMIEELHNLQSISTKARISFESEIVCLENEIAEKNELLENLQIKVNKQSDYDELKREISIMKMIEFTGIEEESNSKGLCTANSLEKLLLEKNKNLQSECTSLKVSNAEVLSRYEELVKNYTESSHVVKEQSDLIKQLEADLLNVRGLPSTLYRGEGVGASSPPDSEVIFKAVKDISTDEVDEVEKQNADSLLPIISSQRERFRNRNLELESQSAHQQRQITMLQNEVDSVRHDNVKLYEKIKFLQSYPTQGSINVQVEDDSVKRYSSQYEERIDPFAVFSQREKQQRYSNLTAPEKVTLNMGRFILSNKIARTLVFFYTLLLHCLVFIVLYKFAFIEPCKRMIPAAAPDSAWFQNQLPSSVSKLAHSTITT